MVSGDEDHDGDANPRNPGGEAGSVVLRRRFEVSIEELWSACTDPARLRRWFGDVTGDARPGGTTRVDIGERDLLTCRIVHCAAPRELVVTWEYGSMPADEVWLRLTPDGGATLLELEHRSDVALRWAKEGGAGWEDWIFRLGTMLAGGDGRAPSSDEMQALLVALWSAVSPDDGHDSAPA
jgi:uncharacterized protein YndB with AHSA1/START domain